MKRTSILGICWLFLLCPTADAQNVTSFHSNRPAQTWEEYLVSANGTLGLMVAGNPYREELVVNHTNLFMPIHAPHVPPSQGKHLQEIRQMMANGKFQEASERLIEISHTEGFGKKRQSDLFVPAFQLNLRSDSTRMETYRRGVDFLSGEARVEWSDSRGHFLRRSFVSRTDSVIVTEVKALAGTLDMTIDLQTIRRFDPKRKVKFCLDDSLNIKKVEQTVSADGIAVRVWYATPWKDGYQGYEGMVKLCHRGGKVKVDGQRIVVSGAKSLLLLTEAAPVTDMTILPADLFGQHLSKISRSSYEKLLAPHRDWQSAMMRRVSLDLGADSASRALNSEALLALGGSHPAVIERLFNAARYNILSATGTNPPNLQGIWGATMTPPWAGDYTTNGNLPTAVSHYLQASTPELMLPLFDKLESQLDDYRRNAQVLFGCRGIHVPSHIQLHGLDNQFDATWPMTFWTAGAAWYSMFYYDYWLHTRDEQFLTERALPFMCEAALFYEDFLTVTDSAGQLVFTPSYSPENHPKNSRSQACINATMDVAVCKALLRDLIHISEQRNLNKERLPRWRQMLAQMPAYEVNADGELREWLWSDLQDNHEHRHASHLIGLYYRRDPEIMQSEVLRKGALRAVQRRLDYRKTESGIMAFGVSQLAFPACNLRQGELAGEMLTLAANTYFNNNLMTTHDPHHIFNTDMSGAYPAMVMQMLAYSDEGYVELLPALPADWKQGCIKGMSLRGGIRVDSLAWNRDQCVAVLVSDAPQTINVTLAGRQPKSVTLQKGVPSTVTFKLGDLATSANSRKGASTPKRTKYEFMRNLPVYADSLIADFGGVGLGAAIRF